MEEMKECPFCGKEILAVAKMCKYCREWLPDESTNPNIQKSVENSQGEKSFSMQEYTQDKESTETEPEQTTVLSKEERDARIEALKKERNKLMFEKTRAANSGDTEREAEVKQRIHELIDEIHKLDVEKGLEEGYWVRTDDGTIVSNRVISYGKKPFWKRLF